VIVPLPSNRPPERFYRGGDRIAAFRGSGPAGTHEPEDWVASTTTVRGEAPAGLTRLPDGRLLADAIAADPQFWLGQEHVARWGTDTRLLVKLLDAGQRLPVHAHPDDGFAAARLGHAHGKAEAWYVLRAGTVHLGLRRPVAPAELGALVPRRTPRTCRSCWNGGTSGSTGPCWATWGWASPPHWTPCRSRPGTRPGSSRPHRGPDLHHHPARRSSSVWNGTRSTATSAWRRGSRCWS